MMRYPEYKESGVEWIGEIPKQWEVIRCTNLFELKHIKNTSGEINLSVYRDYGVIKRDSRDDNHNRISENTSNYKLVEPGDFVFNKMKCWQGSLGISEYRGIVSPAYTICKPKKSFFGKYFHHLLRSNSYIQEYKRLSYGIRTGQWELRFEDFKNMIVPYPSKHEQTQIANFLDRKTEQIDKLIRIKERKIELLQEQRIALINHAVTKGLDPNVEMKPSGVKWIGEIPTHWEVKRLKYIANINMGQSPPSEEYNNDQVGTPFLQGNAEFGSHHPTPKIYCPIAKKYAHIGDILLSVRAPVGAINIANQKYGIGRGLCAIRPQANQLEHRYAKYLLEVVRTELHTIATGSTYDAVTVDEVSNITCVVTLFSEQQQIANFLDSKTKQIDESINAEHRKIEHLKEYRQSLISEAVTGKIDVRNKE